MKNLFFIVLAGAMFSKPSGLKAQTNINIEKIADRTQPNPSLKFIEDIELTPAVYSGSLPTPEKIAAPVPALISASNTRSNTPGSIEACSALQFKYAMLMDKEVERIANISLYSFIDQWWGTRYRYGGTDRTGIDCSALTAKLLLEVYGQSIPRTAKDQYDLCEKIATADLIEGDLVFFNTRGGVSHVGLYLGDNYFVQSSVHGGVIISSLDDDYYKKKYIGGGRISRSSN